MKQNSISFRSDLKRDWSLVRDVGETQLFSPEQLELVSLLKKGESYINSEKLFRRAKEKQCCLGQRQAEYLLERQKEIPKRWRQYYLLFPGTVWLVHITTKTIPCLEWSVHLHWHMSFHHLYRGSGFRPYNRVLRPHE